jgi:molybdopterin-guanine dinucleotide biosynthesis protein A
MGVRKETLRLGGRPILAYLLDRFAWPGPTMLVTAPGHEHPPGHERFSTEVVDAVAGQGPLRGVLTALEHATTDVVVVTTVDMPGVARAQLDWLVERLRPTQPAGVMTLRAGQVEPFPSAFHRSAAAGIRTQLSARQFAVRDVEGVAHLPAPPEWDETVWTNLNRPNDLESFTRRPSAPRP